MHVTIGMIVLNEEEYILKNLQQHYEHAHKIVIVEGADRLYPQVRVTKHGLSTDATAEIVRNFPDPSHKIKFIQHGWTNMTGPNAKCELRNRYLRETPDGLLIVIDADEFYRHKDIADLIDNMRRHPRYDAYQLPQIHFWHNLQQFITGGYYDMHHCRFWHVKSGDSYSQDHNYPTRGTKPLRNGYVRVKPRKVHRTESGKEFVKAPCCYHFGFVKNQANMKDKNRYYENRGEKRTRYRTYKSREAWFKPDEQLYPRLAIHQYEGPLPECFEEHSLECFEECQQEQLATERLTNEPMPLAMASTA